MILKNTDLVTALLEKYPPLRDNDQELMATVYINKLGPQKVAHLTALDLLDLLAQGKLPSFESVTRSRRRVQEDIPELRGARWNERHHTEKDVREEVRR